MKDRLASIFLILFLTLSTHLLWAQQRKEVLQAKVLVEAIAEAYGKPICSDEIKQIERLVGLQENYMADKVNALKISQSNFCSDSKTRILVSTKMTPRTKLDSTFKTSVHVTFS